MEELDRELFESNTSRVYIIIIIKIIQKKDNFKMINFK